MAATQKQLIPGNTLLYSAGECDTNFIKRDGTTLVNAFTIQGDTNLNGNLKLIGTAAHDLDLGEYANIICSDTRTNAINLITNSSNWDNIKGAGLSLCTPDHSTSPGCFKLLAKNSSGQYQLLGAPDGTLKWNTKNITLDGDCLPRTGGTISGTIIASGDGRILRYVNDLSSLRIDGGSSWDHGASLILRGAQYSDPEDNNVTAGEAKIRVSNGSDKKDLIIKPDGTFTWNGKNVTLSGDCLPVSNGIITEVLSSNVGKIDDISANPTPSTSQFNTVLVVTDNNKHKIGSIETALYNSGKLLNKFGAHNANGDYVHIDVGWNANGISCAVCPNPQPSSNTNEIATTWWVTTKINALLDVLNENV